MTPTSRDSVTPGTSSKQQSAISSSSSSSKPATAVSSALGQFVSVSVCLCVFVCVCMSVCHCTPAELSRWRRGAVGRVSDLLSRGRRFESRLGTQRKNSGQGFTPVCICSPSSISWYRPKSGDALWLGRKGRYGLCSGESKPERTGTGPVETEEGVPGPQNVNIRTG